MPRGNPTPFRHEMYMTSLARSAPDFRIKQFLKQYFLSKFELAAKGYDKLNYFGFTEEGFDGFISKNECSISNGEVIAVCMINPRHRVSFGEYVAKEESYGVHFWCLRTHKQMGNKSLSSDCLMMEVGGFPKINIGYELYDGMLEMEEAENFETFIPKYKDLAYEMNEIGCELFAKCKAVCYPVMISQGFELIEKEGLKFSSKE